MKRRAITRLTVSLAVLAGAIVLLVARVEPVPTWFYVFAWYPTLGALDALVELWGGQSLLERPRELAAMLWWSAVIWLLFEVLNFRLQNWYYVDLPRSLPARWLGETLSFATVVPAILVPERVLGRLGFGATLRTRPLTRAPHDMTWSLALGGATLVATLVWPRTLYPLTWGALWLIAEPLLYRRDPTASLFGDVSRGEWGRIARLMLAGLVAGGLWESFNGGAGGRWIYTVPFLEQLKIFEMPPIGFIGFAFFALEAWSLYQLLARVSWSWLLPSVAFATLALGGMDYWTVSSVVPRDTDLPGVTAAVHERLRSAELADVAQLAAASPAAIGRVTELSANSSSHLRDAARLAELRGIGGQHAAELVAAGIASPEDLAAADPDAVWRAVRGGGARPRPTAAEVRVWVRAAQELVAR